MFLKCLGETCLSASPARAAHRQVVSTPRVSGLLRTPGPLDPVPEQAAWGETPAPSTPLESAHGKAGRLCVHE